MITLINGNAQEYGGAFDMVFTDPPFEMSGCELHSVLSRFDFEHLVLIASMRQILEFYSLSGLKFGWQMVFDFVTPTKNRSYTQPHLRHANICYFRKQGAGSAFDRRRVSRRDQYSDGKASYYPSIFHAPKRELDYKYQKNQGMIDDLLGAFNVQSVCDPFAGTGSTGVAALTHGMCATLIESDSGVFEVLRQKFELLGYAVGGE